MPTPPSAPCPKCGKSKYVVDGYLWCAYPCRMRFPARSDGTILPVPGLERVGQTIQRLRDDEDAF